MENRCLVEERLVQQFPGAVSATLVIAPIVDVDGSMDDSCSCEIKIESKLMCIYL